MDQSIASYVLGCLELFDNVLEVSKASATEVSSCFNRDTTDQQTRFKVWSGNIGAHRVGVSSLDYRLRDSSHIRSQIVSLLKDIIDLLKDAVAIILGDKPPWDQLAPDEDMISNGNTADSDFPNTELDQITVDIKDVVNCLLRLSTAIRNPAPHDRFAESHSTVTSHYEQFDIQHVYSKFGSIDRSLAERLGKAISRRRQYFKYRLAHRTKLSQGLNRDVPDVETVASSLPERLKDGSNTTGIFAIDATRDGSSETGFSQTSYATSAGDVGGCRVPPLPEEASQGPFECPFCYMIINSTTRSSWKKHIYADLQPYVCLAKDCTTPEKTFPRRHRWMEHMKKNHWKTYPCPTACGMTFISASECMKHTCHSHASVGTLKEIEALVHLHERPLDLRQGISCPICAEHIYSGQQYRRHVGRHQEQLALFALPTFEPSDENRSDNEDKSDSDSTDVPSDHNGPIESDYQPAEGLGRSLSPPGSYNSAPRQNEYFVPRDGIEPEVITADICRYLGNDASVRPGSYENPNTGQAVRGYYVFASRNLTTAIVEDLKADSARWDSEKRALTSRDPASMKYCDSEIHQARQHHGSSDEIYKREHHDQSTS